MLPLYFRMNDDENQLLMDFKKVERIAAQSKSLWLIEFEERKDDFFKLPELCTI